MQRFADQTALITGGGSGIGLAIAMQLADEGAKVVLFDRNEEFLTKAAEKLRRDGAGVATAAGDVNNPLDVDRAFAIARDGMGPVDVLVNNAGVWQAPKPYVRT